MSREEATLNIGALSMATGVPVETIRTWERRYGFPQSDRNEAGHRIYDVEMIEHLRLITEILSNGYRPSQLEGRSREELEELLDKTTPDGERRPRRAGEDSTRWLDDWFDAVVSLDRERFVSHLRSHFSRLPALRFLEDRLGPFLTALGEGWAEGRFNVMHEHFASELVRDFLVERWRPLANAAQKRPLVLVTLPGERHCLGLHMCALVVALADHRVVFLGADTPVEEIETAMEECDARGVIVSISEYPDREESRDYLARLDRLAGTSREIFVGGSGAGEDVSGEVIDSFRDLFDHLED